MEAVSRGPIPGSLGVIPARYASTRFPGKPLAMIGGKPMIVRVYERVCLARLAEVVIATDDERIDQVAREHGCVSLMTSPDHASGTDRAAEIARTHSARFIVNIQGDEPLIAPELIDDVATALAAGPHDLVTARRLLTDPAAIESPHVTKVVTDCAGKALYFSRMPIPCRARARADVYQHIGIYGYRREALLRLAALPPSPLELAESLEQLRALENGMSIGVIDTDYLCLAVDLPEDVARIDQHLRELVS
ncbi:MAG: 3-deoxy-manno-octulosonate cytidylyltransferase [Gemmataceae bacterium]